MGVLFLFSYLAHKYGEKILFYLKSKSYNMNNPNQVLQYLDPSPVHTDWLLIDGNAQYHPIFQSIMNPPKLYSRTTIYNFEFFP